MKKFFAITLISLAAIVSGCAETAMTVPADAVRSRREMSGSFRSLVTHVRLMTSVVGMAAIHGPHSTI